VAYFFHSSLQGLEAEEGALEVLRALPLLGKRVGLVANGQRFTPVQMLRAFQRQGTLRSLDELFDPALVTLSCREGIRKPSKSLYQRALERFRRMGVAPHQVLYVGTRLRDDVAVAKQAGMRTALLAVDQTSFTATREELADPELRPERLLTNLAQVREVAGH
jgi:FMN phosphatase YigB (HAD superfamily)